MTQIDHSAGAGGPHGRFRSSRALRLAGSIIVAIGAALGATAPAPGQQVARIAAVVNDKSISVMDVQNRAELVIFSSGLSPSPEVYRRLTPQILQTLIDEQLQLQEANARNINVSDAEIDAILRDMEQRNNLPAGGLDEFLAERGIEKTTLESQIRANLGWRKLIRARFQRQAEVGEEEIDEAMRNLQAASDKPRNLVAEIFLSVDDPASEEKVRQSALRIMQQIRNGGRFDELARAFSQNAAAASGGDLGWLVQGQLDDQLEEAISTMQPGEISSPIRSGAGYHIILLRDRRFPGGASPDNVTVDLRQITLPLAQLAGEDEIRAVAADADKIRRTVHDCEALSGPLPGGAAVGKIGRLRVSDLAPQIQQTVMALGPNQISAPLRAPDAIVMVMVCDRKTEGDTLPDRNEIADRLRMQKLDLLSRRYLRDLRRSAFIDVRINDAYANRSNDG